MRDYYTLLGLSNENPSDDELKKAYKKAALKHHPDRNPKNKEAAEAKFKKVAEAYAVLSDKQKKHIYDTYGEEGLKNGPPPPSHAGFGMGGMGDMGGGNIFSDGDGRTFVFSSGPGGMGMGGMGGGSMGSIDAHDLFAQLFGDNDMGGFGGGFGGLGGFGGGGMGGMGRGMPGIPKSRKAGMHSPQSKESVHKLSCTLDELYHGTHKKLKVTRNLTDATGKVVPAAKVLEVDVQPGWKAGTKVRFAGAGDEQPDGSTQDIVFVLDEKPHKWFRRDGDDLHYTAKLSPEQARKGVKVTIPTLDGRKLKLETAAAIPHGKKRVMAGEGMPTKSGGKGALVLEFSVGAAA